MEKESGCGKKYVDGKWLWKKIWEKDGLDIQLNIVYYVEHIEYIVNYNTLYLEISS